MDHSDRYSDHAAKLSQRAMTIATACLAVVVLVLVVSMVLIISVAVNAQRNTNRFSDDAEALQIELECRSEISAQVTVAQGEVSSLVALALVALAKDDPSQFSAAVEDIEEAVDSLRDATERRSTSVQSCSSDLGES